MTRLRFTKPTRAQGRRYCDPSVTSWNVIHQLVVRNRNVTNYEDTVILKRNYNKSDIISDSDDLYNNLVRLIKRFTFNDKRSRAKKEKEITKINVIMIANKQFLLLIYHIYICVCISADI